jgi:hypothetical protein
MPSPIRAACCIVMVADVMRRPKQRRSASAVEIDAVLLKALEVDVVLRLVGMCNGCCQQRQQCKSQDL